MKLEFTGLKVIRRIVGDIEWSVGIGLVQEVPAELAAELLTADPDFMIASSDPFYTLKGITESEIISLVLAGIGTVGALRELDNDGNTRLSEATGISRKKISLWAEAHEQE